jgi:hypothetical protein
MINFKTVLADAYLEYFNDYLSVEKFAEHHKMDEETAKYVLELGRKFHDDRTLIKYDSVQAIKDAVLEGKKVYWSNNTYEVRYDEKTKDFYQICVTNNYMIGLTWQDGVTLNGKLEEFYSIKEVSCFDCDNCIMLEGVHDLCTGYEDEMEVFDLNDAKKKAKGCVKFKWR